MNTSDLAPNPHNPRTVTDKKKSMLRKALMDMGDLSGVILNRKTKRLVGGHRRREAFGASQITITNKYSKPTKTGTVAEGYITFNGERFAYREVYWDETKEKIANLAANKSAGEWDLPKLNNWLSELSSFDLDLDLDLTMFDSKELAELPKPVEVAAHTRVNGKGEKKVKPPKCKPGQLYRLGTARLKVGDGDLHFCDLVLSQWRRHTGEAAILAETVKLKKTAKAVE